MKRALFRLPLLLTLGGLLITGCSTQEPHHPVYVAPWGAVTTSRPLPPSREGIVGAPPGSKLEWRDGYWVFVNWRWVWIPGHWEEYRRSNAIWVPGRWEHQQGSWRWQPGRWEERDQSAGDGLVE